MSKRTEISVGGIRLTAVSGGRADGRKSDTVSIPSYHYEMNKKQSQFILKYSASQAEGCGRAALPNRPGNGLFFRLPKRDAMHGFSLIEIAVVLIVISVLMVIVAAPLGSIRAQRATEDTNAKLAALDATIAVYVAQNGRLPCPANGTLDGTANANAGLEQVNVGITACTLVDQTSGVVPWKTLGVQLADVTDGWGNVFTYRVDESLIRTQAMNFTACSPGGTGAAMGGAPNFTCAPCTSATFPAACTPPATVIAGRGIRVRDVGGTLLADPAAAVSTGVAYIVISHGENRNGSYSPQGVLQVGGTPASGTEEARNAANLPNTPAGTFYLVDSPAMYADGVTHFDDIVLRRTILALASKAGLAPRAY